MNSENQCPQFVASILESVRSSLSCRPNGRVTSIAMPLLHADGDAIEVHVLPSYGYSEIIVSDVGLTVSRLESEGMQPRKERLVKLLASLDVHLGENDELYVKCTAENIGIKCLRLAQAISNTSAVSYMRTATKTEDFLHEFDVFLKSHKIQSERNVKRNVAFDTDHGLTMQQPVVDFQLSNEILVMTVPANPKARRRKLDACYRAWNVLDRAKDKLPRITVFDSEVPMGREDSNLLGDFSAVVPFNALDRSDLNADDISDLAKSRVVIGSPALN